MGVLRLLMQDFRAPIELQGETRDLRGKAVNATELCHQLQQQGLRLVLPASHFCFPSVLGAIRAEEGLLLKPV